MGIGTGLARAYGNARSIAHEQDEAARLKQQQDEQRAIQQLAAEMALRAQGVVPEAEAVEAPQFTGGAFNLDGTMQPVAAAPKRFKPLGHGYALDQQGTPEAKAERVRVTQERKQATERARVVQQRTMALAAHPRFKDAAPELRQQVAESDEAWGAAMKALTEKPEGPQAPVMGSPEWQAAKRFEAGLSLGNSKALAQFQHGLPDKPKAGQKGEEKLTEGERRGGALITMARDAAPILRGATAPGRWQAFAAQIGFNEAVDDQRQVLEQAASQLVSSYLYLVSGATATDDEVKRQARALIPQPGDKAPAMLRKKAAMEAMLRAMEIAAGRGAQPADSRVEPRPTVPPYPNNPFRGRP